MSDSFMTTVFFVLVLILSLVVHYYYITNFTRVARLCNKFPGDKRLYPFLGNAVSIMGPITEIQSKMTAYCEKYGRVCLSWWFYEPKICIADATTVEKILSSSFHIEKGPEYEPLKANLHDGLLTSSGEKWRRDRKLLNPGFARQQMDRFVHICNKKSKILIERLAAQFKQCKNTGATNFLPHFTNVALEIVFESGLGTELCVQSDGQHSKFATSIETIARLLQVRLFNPWLVKIPLLFKIFGYEKVEKDAVEYCTQFVKRAWRCKKNEIEIANETCASEKGDEECNIKTKNKHFIDLLLEANLGSEKYCIDHLTTLVIAGADTTANSINNTLLYLALNPECQKLCHETIDSVFSQYNGDLTIGALSELKYLEMCWKESLRLWPVINGITRRIMRDIELDNGLIIPKGCDVIISLYDLHRDAKIFPNPSVFNPDRFTEEASASRSSFAWIPFGAGIRNCIGFKHSTLESKIILAHFLRKYQVSTPLVERQVKFVAGIVSSAHPTIKLSLMERCI